MGIVVSSHGLTDDGLRALVSEYAVQSIKSLEESWNIYRDEVGAARFLPLAQFDEVFGILVHDPEPHFQLFEQPRATDAPAVVGAEVFIGICLALPADIKAKLTFLFRMYLTDPSDVYIASHVKIVIYRDFVSAITKLLHLSEPPSTEVLTAVESVLRDNNDDSKHVTVKEAIDFALTHPSICACFEELDALFSGLRDALQRAAAKPAIDTFDDSDGDPPVAPPPEPLFRAKVRDVGKATFAVQDVLELPEDLSCFLALKRLQQQKRAVALVVGKGPKKTHLGLVDCQVFVRCMLALMPPLEMDMRRLGACTFNHKKLSDMEVLKYESYAVDAGRRFAMLPLRDVLRMHHEANDLVAETPPGLRVSFSDDFAFNAVYRLATHDTHVPVALSPAHPADVVGVLSATDVLRFVLEDVSLLGELAHRPLGELPWVYTPLAMRRQSSSMLEAFQLMKARRVAGLLLLDDAKDESYSCFGWADILELVENWPPRDTALPPIITISTPLPNFGYLLRPIGHVLKSKPVPTLATTNSLAKGVSILYRHSAARVYVEDAAGEIVGRRLGWPRLSLEAGVLRATDVLRALLEVQLQLHKRGG
ncbi:hypothetical protein ACHHYP_00359 [Achlya hypogyna]|uniref:CBS domain-containing protein n=1 Tax=Achlya hypogyna TaxID=1202772 RepID=A0A1V9ZB45_ACHHY|nr:hypothetical protein ACHHYP_00359 [Achlya hypogyna]